MSNEFKEMINLDDLENVAGGAGAAKFTYKKYTVKSGDTLWTIAAKLKAKGVPTTAQELFDGNKSTIIAEAKKHGVKCKKQSDYMNYLWVGEVIYVPSK